MSTKNGLVASAQVGADRYRRRLLAAAGLSSNVLLSNLNTTVTVKSSPAKSASETGRLGIISGYLTKRNEQHSWQRRFCALVPQSFLYYFEDDDSDAPRGIIDLEYYTDISAQPNNVVKLATGDGSHRTFYFQADSEEEMNAWMSALIRERYFVLRDERDAYQELQHDFQAQSAADGDEVKRVVAERRVVVELEERASREEAEVAHQLNELLDVVGEKPSNGGNGASTCSGGGGAGEYQQQIDEADVRALEVGGRALVKRVSDLEARLAESKNGAARLDQELKDYRDAVQAATAELEIEAKALAREQKAKSAEMEDVAQLNAELEEGEVNLAIIERTKESAEARVAELTDQKKLLVREIKSARKLLASKQTAEIATNQRPLPAATSSVDASDDEDALPASRIVRDTSSDFSASTDVASLADIAPPVADHPTTTTTNNNNKSSFLYTAASLFASTAAANTPPPQRKKKSLLSVTDESYSSEDETRFIVRCKRCRGTLEGPKNSTCTCVEPLLVDSPTMTSTTTNVSSYLKSLLPATFTTSPPKQDSREENGDDQRASAEASDTPPQTGLDGNDAEDLPQESPVDDSLSPSSVSSARAEVSEDSAAAGEDSETTDAAPSSTSPPPPPLDQEQQEEDDDRAGPVSSSSTKHLVSL